MKRRSSRLFVPAMLAPVSEQHVASVGAPSSPSTRPLEPRDPEILPLPLPQMDHIIKLTLKQFKKLELQLNKFNLKKLNTQLGCHLKGNILRTLLLPLLRHHKDLGRHFTNLPTMYKLLVSVIVAVLIKWWKLLIANLMIEILKKGYGAGLHPIPASDRNAYLELISRMMALPYWDVVDADFYENFKTHLTTTLHWSITKLSTIKTVTVSMAAFVGKVFAHLFIHLPQVLNALLFLLNVKQESFEKARLLLDADKCSADAMVCFPQHLAYLSDFRGVPVTSHPIHRQAQCINCVPPPKQAVRGIKDPQGNWVRRWASSDLLVFVLFFRHYMTIVDHRLRVRGVDATKTLILSNCPGFTVLYAHIVHTINMLITNIAVRAHLRPKQQNPNATMTLPQFSINPLDVYYSLVIKLFRMIRDITYCLVMFPSTEVADLAALATLSTLPVGVSGALGVAELLVRFVDRALADFAALVSVHNQLKLTVVLNITYEFINQIVNNIPMLAALIDWEFWLACTYQMLDKTDQIQTLLKTFSFLFNVWPQIPDALTRGNPTGPHFAWLIDLNELYKLNFVNWLLSNQVFVRFMTHWLLAVRIFYMRLLVWRVIGVNNSQLLPQILTTKRLQDKINKLYNVVHDFAVLHGHRGLNFCADHPLVNRKFGILPMNAKDDYLLDDLVGGGVGGLTAVPKVSSVPSPALLTPIKPLLELRKSHPYEVFDEAIYTCLLLPLSLTNSSDELIDAKPKGLVTLLGRWFKFMLNDSRSQSLVGLGQIENEVKLTKRNSVLLTSLSTAYSLIKLRSSLPLIMLFGSQHTNFTELPTLSMDSDDESITTLEIKAGGSRKQSPRAELQPAEFSRMPPDIVRPIYKFDIVMDTELMGQRCRLINDCNHSQCKFAGHLLVPQGIENFPHCPKIPLILIYFTLETTRFYLRDEGDVDIDNFIDADAVLNRDAVTLLAEYSRYYKGSTMSLGSRDPHIVRLVNLGKSLNELNHIIDEFKLFLNTRVEIDQFNDEVTTEFNEKNYFSKIIPYLPIDSSNELKLLNAN